MTQNELTRLEHAQPNIPVLYEDNHVLAVVKPVNVPTQEDASGDPDLLSLLKEDLKIRHNKPGNVFGFSSQTGSACRWSHDFC